MLGMMPHGAPHFRTSLEPAVVRVVKLFACVEFTSAGFMPLKSCLNTRMLLQQTKGGSVQQLHLNNRVTQRVFACPRACAFSYRLELCQAPRTRLQIYHNGSRPLHACLQVKFNVFSCFAPNNRLSAPEAKVSTQGSRVAGAGLAVRIPAEAGS